MKTPRTVILIACAALIAVIALVQADERRTGDRPERRVVREDRLERLIRVREGGERRIEGDRERLAEIRRPLIHRPEIIRETLVMDRTERGGSLSAQTTMCQSTSDHSYSSDSALNVSISQSRMSLCCVGVRSPVGLITIRIFLARCVK